MTTLYFTFLYSYNKQTISTDYASNKTNWLLKGNRISFYGFFIEERHS